MTDVFTATGVVVITKVAVLAPAVMDTLWGTWAAEALLLLSVITAPLGGADPVRVTVPVELLPPITEPGVLVTDDKDA